MLEPSFARQVPRPVASVSGAMDTIRKLPQRFDRARLELELLDAPLARSRGTESIVQIDIAPASGTKQRFRLYPGAGDNRVEVLGTDPARRQLVLFVDEARRAFQTVVSRRVAVPKGARLVSENAKQRVIEQYTEGRKRHFLCGMDEQHLFIAELPCGVSSTHAAREALRAPEVPSSLVLRGERIVRQGEWFFLPVLPRERSAVEIVLQKGRVLRNVGIAQAAGIPRAGRPHVADEVAIVEAGNGVSSGSVFVRGAVRHPDHQTLVLRDFRRAVPNRERFAQPAGVYWVD
jgi:hypothetical protein